MEHIPLYRQSEIYARQGVELSRNTMVRWVSEMADKLRPLYIALNDYVLEAGKVHADDTPVKVLAPGNGKTKTGRVKEAGCLAHARRKIHDEDVRRPTEMTQEALRRIAELYDIEAEIRGSPAEERLAVRKARSVQLMQSLYDWIQLQRKTLSKHAEMAKAFDYILNHWNALNEFCRDGWVEIDNNIGENALRSVAVGRKNYLFFGSDKGGESAAIIYSLLVTCKQNEVEPEDWLREVIEKLNDWPSNQVHELLPWNFSSVK
ncbi:transposase IS66 family protein [Shigella boydii 5216-82]|nr:transposase IS66 family protein [Shigella boydii 5216-82]